MDMIGWLARYEVTVDATLSGGGVGVFRFTSRANAVWALRFGAQPDLARASVITARDRWTGKAITL